MLHMEKCCSWRNVAHGEMLHMENVPHGEILLMEKCCKWRNVAHVEMLNVEKC